MPKILSLNDLRACGIAYTDCSLRRLESKGLFPRRFKVGPRRVAWNAEEIAAYLSRAQGVA
jgi:predicted DNA-binding transcriptional regulator AlpA